MTASDDDLITPKLEPLVMERLREMSRYARVAFFARLTAGYCQLCGDDGEDDDGKQGPRCTGQCAEKLGPPKCVSCGQPEAAHPVACFGCQTCMFTCDHYICVEYATLKVSTT